MRARGNLRQPARPGAHGDLYSCDHYVEPAYLLGNIKDMLELIALPRQQQFGCDKRDMGRMRCAA